MASRKTERTAWKYAWHTIMHWESVLVNQKSHHLDGRRDSGGLAPRAVSDSIHTRCIRLVVTFYVRLEDTWGCCWKILAEQADGIRTVSADRKKSHPKAYRSGLRTLLSSPEDFSNRIQGL